MSGATCTENEQTVADLAFVGVDHGQIELSCVQDG